MREWGRLRAVRISADNGTDGALRLETEEDVRLLPNSRFVVSVIDVESQIVPK